MTYPKSPKNDQQARLYALTLSSIHNKKWIPIRRKNPINNKFALNFQAVEEGELSEYEPEWEEIK